MRDRTFPLLGLTLVTALLSDLSRLHTQDIHAVPVTRCLYCAASAITLSLSVCSGDFILITWPKFNKFILLKKFQSHHPRGQNTVLAPATILIWPVFELPNGASRILVVNLAEFSHCVIKIRSHQFGDTRTATRSYWLLSHKTVHYCCVFGCNNYEKHLNYVRWSKVITN